MQPAGASATVMLGDAGTPPTLVTFARGEGVCRQECRGARRIDRDSARPLGSIRSAYIPAIDVEKSGGYCR